MRMSLGVHGSPTMAQAPSTPACHPDRHPDRHRACHPHSHPTMRIPDQVAQDARRALPQLDRLLDDPAVAALSALYGREQVKVQARRMPAALRGRGGTRRRVLNATGVFVHTNLGRAPLPRAVAAALPPLLDAYCDLEIDLTSGRRGQRNGRGEQLLTGATGAAAAPE